MAYDIKHIYTWLSQLQQACTTDYLPNTIRYFLLLLQVAYLLTVSVPLHVDHSIA